MTTPTTAELRSWARAHGMDVGDRGRLSPEVRAAWDAAHGAGGPAATEAAPSRVAAATTTSRRTAAATVRPAPRRTATKRAQPKAGAGTAAPTAETPAQEPAPSPEVVLQEDPRVDDLERKLGELARRVAQLERAAAAPPPRRGFRRRG